jgi:hypothetical protein
MTALFLARLWELYDHKGTDVAAVECLAQGCQ